MDLSKYQWKYRLILVKTPSYKHPDYIKTKEIYDQNIQEFHKRYIKLLSHRKKEFDFKISLIGFDGESKKTYQKLEPKKIFSLVDKMPMGKLMKNNPKLNPQNLSLYSDYNKETTIKGLGFKDKEKALYTLDRIKNEPIKYQTSLVATMIGRAKTHPHQTQGMRDALKIYQQWMDDYKKKK